MNTRFSDAALAAVLAIMTLVTSNLNWSGNFWQNTLETDAKGYYAHLPAIFIYNDLSYGFFEKVEIINTPPHFIYDYRVSVGKGITNKYFVGTAIAEAPFFLAAHAFCLMKNTEANGFTKPYVISITIAALFYLILGMLFIRKTLLLYQVRDWVGGIMILVVTFGTNLFYYVVGEPGMSHVYSFAFVSLFVYFGKCFFNSGNSKLLIPISVILGLIILIRPVNGLILLCLPFLAETWELFKLRLGQVCLTPIKLVFPLLAFSVVVGLQLIIYRISTGQFFVYSYGEEGLDILDPHFVDILFSYKKGLFVYTPVYLLMVLSSLWLFWRKWYVLGTYIFFFVALTYILSSWWNWWYGGSFSSRVYIEFLPILCIPMAQWLTSLKSLTGRATLVMLLFILVVLCQIQTYQYRYYIIHWEEMTKTSYWENFLKL